MLILNLFNKWRKDLKYKKHYELMEIILDESGYSKMLKDKKDLESEGRLENIKELIRGMHDFDNLIGNHNGITMAGSHGHFELNVFKPLIAHNILQSIDLIADSTRNFALYCVKDIKANKKKIQEHLDNSLMLVTALAPKIGYDNAAQIAKTALNNNTTLKFETLKTGLISEKDYNKIVDPKKMIYPA